MASDPEQKEQTKSKIPKQYHAAQEIQRLKAEVEALRFSIGKFQERETELKAEVDRLNKERPMTLTEKEEIVRRKEEVEKENYALKWGGTPERRELEIMKQCAENWEANYHLAEQRLCKEIERLNSEVERLTKERQSVHAKSNEFNVSTYIPEDPKIVEIYAQLNNPLSRLFYDMALEIETIPASIEQSRVVCLFRTLGLKVTELYEAMKNDKITAQNAHIQLQEEFVKHKQVEQDAYNAKDTEIKRLKDVVDGLKFQNLALMENCPTIHSIDKESIDRLKSMINIKGAEIQRLNNEIALHSAKVKEQEAYIEKLESEAYLLQKQWQDLTSDYTRRRKDLSQAISSGRPEGISSEHYHRVLPVALKELQGIEDVLKTIEKLQRGSNQLSKTITIEKGIIVIMRDGRIINFPNGNDETYKAWCKTSESETFLTMLGAREEFLEHELERAEADQIVRGKYENQSVGSVEDSDDLEDRIEEFCKHTDPRKYTKKMQEEMAKPQDQVKP